MIEDDNMQCNVCYVLCVTELMMKRRRKEVKKKIA